MSHRDDWIERVRQRWLPAIHLFLQRLHPRLYATAEMPEFQRVGTCEHHIEQVEYFLYQRYGFNRNWLASLKYRLDDVSGGSWGYRDSLFADYQLHVILFVNDDSARRTDVYAHLEYNALRHPVRHYATERLSAEGGVEAARALIPWFGESEADLADGLDAYAEEVFD